VVTSEGAVSDDEVPAHGGSFLRQPDPCDGTPLGQGAEGRRREAIEQGGVLGEPGHVFEGEAGGAPLVARHGQCRYLDELTVAPRYRAHLLLGPCDVRVGGGGVPVVRGPDGEQGEVDRVHDVTVHLGADLGLRNR
jgi:hypothetical protein